MAHNIPNEMDLTDQVNRPFWLVTLDIPGNLTRWSSREQMTLDGITFFSQSFKVNHRRSTGTGFTEYELVAPAHNRLDLLHKLRNNDYQGELARIWQGEGQAANNFSDTLQLIEGIMGGYRYNSQGEEIRLTITSQGHLTRRAPFLLINGDWIPEPGSVISVNGNEGTL